MAILIGHASIGELGAKNNVAGDSTGKEVCTRGWYDGGWHTVLRCKDSQKAEIMAQACEKACANANVGYDQNQRNTLRAQAKAAKWDLSKVGKCECDCSSLVTVCAECANIDIPYNGSNAPTTSTMVKEFTSTGEFEEPLTDSKYLTSDKYLRRGDILVKKGHTVMVLEDGSDAREVEIGVVMHSSAYDKEYTTTAELNLRVGAGTSFDKVTIMKKNASVRCYGYYAIKGSTKWLMVQYGKYMGFCSSNYLTQK